MKNIYKTILVTGSEGQVGKELTKILLKKKYTVVMLDKIKLKKKNYITTDLSDKESLIRSLKFVKKKFSRVDVLINLAALQIFTNFENRTFDELDSMIDVNLRSNIMISQFIFKNFFKKHKQGKIINLGSIFGVVSPNFNNYEKNDRKSSEIYGAVKAAIIQLTKYFANYMSRYNVIVNCISPGGIENRQTQNKAFIKRYSHKVPLKRMAKTQEITNLIEYLISDDSNYINGQNIIIDGGYTAI
jgi:3-oxoacyl-[acyl-carrier protein] reductase